MLTIQWPTPQWRPYAEHTIPEVDVVMVRSGYDGDYTPVATVTTTIIDSEEELQDLGDRAGERFAAQTGGATRVQRSQTDPGAIAPGLSQVLTAQFTVEGRRYELCHLDGFIGTTQEDGSVAVIGISVTCTTSQLPVVGEEFGAVLKSLSDE